MTNCTDCRELERQLEEVALEYFQLNSTQGPENQMYAALGQSQGSAKDCGAKPGDGEMQFMLSFSFRMIRCAKDWRSYVRRHRFVAPARSSPTQAAVR